MVREGKGDEDRTTLLPGSAKKELPQQLRRVEALHAKELERGLGWVELPEALALKCPRAGRELAWQWVFPASRPYRDDETPEGHGGQVCHHRPHESVLRRAIHEAVRAARAARRVGWGCEGVCCEAAVNQAVVNPAPVARPEWMPLCRWSEDAAGPWGERRLAGAV